MKLEIVKVNEQKVVIANPKTHLDRKEGYTAGDNLNPRLASPGLEAMAAISNFSGPKEGRTDRSADQPAVANSNPLVRQQQNQHPPRSFSFSHSREGHNN